MCERYLHVAHVLIRQRVNKKIKFLVYPHDKWVMLEGKPLLTMPTKKTVAAPFAPFSEGTSLEQFVDSICQKDLGLGFDQYAIEQELDPAHKQFDSPHIWERTDYQIYPVDVWVEPEQREPLRARMNGEWWSCEDGKEHARMSPTARGVFNLLLERERRLNEVYEKNPAAELKPEAPRRLLTTVPDRCSMDALAKKWFSRNKHGVRYLPQSLLDRILNVGDRAFNLRVADPYLRYHQQGVGFTWSFFTHKDKQDVHVHPSPIVEIYGVLEGRMEIWSKLYHDRGTSAWNHHILESGDWIEVGSLQCHIVHWLGPGKAVVFKAGPGPLAEVGKLGVKGKTTCDSCPCLKPTQVCELAKCKAQS